MDGTKQKANDRSVKRGLLFLSILAALLYSNWLWGFILNPDVITGGIASDLAVAGQPYHTLFIAADVLSALFIFLTIAFVLKYLKAKNKINTTALTGYGVFGLFTALTAFRPLVCAASVAQCDVQPAVNYYFHFSLGIIAAAGLLVAVISVLSNVHNSPSATLLKSLAVVWISCGVLSLLAPSGFIIPGHIFQKVYLIIGAMLLILVPYLLGRSRKSAMPKSFGTIAE